ncbi:DUF485 domain-containing protein [Streptomyces sp. PTD5-9]|uniref:DUF485 domain-containing protein n=1 Tax=Streptomyces sp. PTD5-9 TaxID=3120150 RepID=UPI00300B1112
MNVSEPARSSPPAAVDPAALLEIPEMQEVLRLRRRFFTRAWVGFGGSLVVLFGWAGLFRPSFGSSVGGGATLGLLVALAHVVVVFALTVAYNHRSRTWDELIERGLARASDAVGSASRKEA